jgi:nucleoside-diphosphate-sugar epimerase
MLKHNASTKIIPERVVVMGAGGFIGASLINSLKLNKIPSLALSSGNLNLLDSDAPGRLADILNSDDTLVVISAIAPCKNNEMLLQNISMMKAVCEAIEKQQPKHLIYLSSDAVYADSPDSLTETSSAEPGSLHGVMHLCREIMLKQVCAVPMAVLRPSLIYGAEDTHNGYGPNQFLRLALADKEITLFGQGEEQRDHVLVDDVISLLQLIILHRSEGVSNAATGTVVSFRRVAEIVSEFFIPQTIINTIPRMGPMPHNGYRPFDPSACLTAFPEFSYTTLADGLEKTYKALAIEQNKAIINGH